MIDAIEWAELSLAYVISGSAAYISLVPTRYRSRLSKHEAMRCSKHCECDREPRPHRRSGLARREAIVSSIWLSAIWPITLTALFVQAVAFGMWRLVLKPIHSLATKPLDRLDVLARLEKETSQEDE